MSLDTHKNADHGHDEIEMPHVSLRDYGIGFILAVVLTAIPFWLVMARPLDTGITVAIIAIFAAVQVVVHMVYFLHMSPKTEDGWSFTTLIFTLIVVVIMLAGSIWVMHNLNANMMPMAHDASQLL